MVFEHTGAATWPGSIASLKTKRTAGYLWRDQRLCGADRSAPGLLPTPDDSRIVYGFKS